MYNLSHPLNHPVHTHCTQVYAEGPRPAMPGPPTVDDDDTGGAPPQGVAAAARAALKRPREGAGGGSTLQERLQERLAASKGQRCGLCWQPCLDLLFRSGGCVLQCFLLRWSSFSSDDAQQTKQIKWHLIQLCLCVYIGLSTRAQDGKI